MFLLEKLNLLLLCKKYGYYFVFLGALLEGDMITVSASYNAYYGQFNLINLMLFIFTVTVVADQIVFFIGKKYKNKIQKLMETKEKEKNFLVKKIKTGYLYFHKYGNTIGIIFRFLVSVRLITPFVLGTTEMTQKKFLLLNIISAVIWVGTICGGGYFLAYKYTYEQVGYLFSWLPIFGVSFMLIIFLRTLLKKN